MISGLQDWFEFFWFRIFLPPETTRPYVRDRSVDWVARQCIAPRPTRPRAVFLMDASTRRCRDTPPGKGKSELTLRVHLGSALPVFPGARAHYTLTAAKQIHAVA